MKIKIIDFICLNLMKCKSKSLVLGLFLRLTLYSFFHVIFNISPPIAKVHNWSNSNVPY